MLGEFDIGRKRVSEEAMGFAAKRLYRTAQGFSPALCVTQNPP
jgi:hypothetical protein